MSFQVFGLPVSRGVAIGPYADLCYAVSREFSEAIPWPEDRSLVFFNEGRFLLRTGEPRKAFEIFTRISAEVPGNAVIEYMQAECLKKLGRYGEAVTKLEQLKMLYRWSSPVTAYIEHQCAEALFDAGESVRSVDRIGLVLFLDVDQPLKALLMDHLSTRLVESPDPADVSHGRQLSRQAFELDPSSVTLGATLAWFLVGTSDNARAEELARAALLKSDSPIDQALSAFVVAKIQWRRGQTKEAERLAAFARYAMPEGTLRYRVEWPLANL